MKKLTIGGMATFNGVLLRSDLKQVITSKTKNNITSEVINLNNNKSKLKKIPVIRGMVSLINSIKTGIPYITKSAGNVIKKVTRENVNINKFELITGYIIAFILFVVTYIVVPVMLSSFTDDDILKVFIQLAAQISIFAVYILSLRNNKYFKKIFVFHGAEHTVVNYYEDNYKKIKEYKSILDIDFDEVKKYSKFHKRCGSNYITFLFILTLLTTAFIPSSDNLNKILIETISFPVLIGFAFEILILSTRFTSLVYNFFRRFMVVQDVTTNTPNKEALSLGVISLLEITNEYITVKDYINEYLFKYDIKNYDVNDIYTLINYKFNIKKEDIISNNIKLNFAKQYELEQLLNKHYIKKIPVSYITNKKYFYNEEYFVNENVLIPRADTEILVEKAIDIINENKFKSVLDLCTGSGNIGISISKNSDVDKVCLVDISDKALKVTKKNIKLNNANNCETILSDLYENVKEEFDIIVSNPPYIESDEINNLDEYVKKEPMLALDGGKKGLNIYIEIFNKAKTYLRNNGYIILEIGYNQNKDLIKLINIYPYLEYIETIKDYGGNDRVVICRLHQV